MSMADTVKPREVSALRWPWLPVSALVQLAGETGVKTLKIGSAT